MDPMLVTCPSCSAEPGEQCRSILFGLDKIRGFIHIGRVTLARKREDQMVEDLLAELDRWAP